MLPKTYSINKQKTLADLNSKDDQQTIVAAYQNIQAEALIRMRKRLSEGDTEHTEEDKETQVNLKLDSAN